MSRVKQVGRVATRYEQGAATSVAMVTLAASGQWV
jgi:transposase